MISRRSFLTATASLPFAARAQSNEVDCALILAVDASASVTPTHQEIQRKGYEGAIADPAVVRAIRGGPLGRIALMFVEWASRDEQRIVMPWTVIHNEASAVAFGAALRGVPPVSWRQTSISGALLFSATQFALCPYQANRKVIDVSGDGQNNDGAPVAEVRDSLVQSRIVINGLPILNGSEPNLLEHYEEQVIGGPGAFAIPVNELGQFRDALTRKLILEIT